MCLFSALGNVFLGGAVLLPILMVGMFLENQPISRPWGFMNSYTCFGFTALAISLLLLRTSNLPKVSTFLAAVVLGLSGFNLLALGFSIGFLSPRMFSPTAVICLFTLSLALLLAQNGKPCFTVAAQMLTLVPCLLATATLLQYLYGIVLFHRVPDQYPMRLLPAVSVLLCSAAILCIRLETGLFSVLLTGYAGSMMARRFAPFLFSLPLVTGLLYKLARAVSSYGPELGTTLVTLSSVVFAAVLLERVARQLNKVDQERNRQHELTEASNRKLAFAIADLQKQNRELTLVREALALETVRDPLTGVYNRRYLNGLIAHLLQPRSQNERFGVLMVDLDHFKRINDTYGHPAGDMALLEVARTLRQNLREGDSLCRHGGEEFVIIMPAVNEDSLLARAEMLCRQVAKLRVSYGDQKFPSITVSVGAILVDDNAMTVEEILSKADQALYHSKESGRNCVTLAELSHAA